MSVSMFYPKTRTYMEEFLKAIKGDTPVFVEFFASWCPHCQRMMPIIDKLKKQKGLHVYQYDIDDENSKELLDYYQVNSVPTMMIFKHGEQLWKWSGEIPEKDLMEVVERRL